MEKNSDKKEGSGSAAPFETATLAEIFIQQGHLKKGLEIYRKLSRLEPNNSEYREKISEITARIEAEGPVVEAPARASGRQPLPAEKSAIEENRIVPEDQNRVLETLNKWLTAVRKRKKHVQ